MTSPTPDYPPAFPFAIHAMTKRQFLTAVQHNDLRLVRAVPIVNPSENHYYVAVVSYSGRRIVKRSIWQLIGAIGAEIVKPVESNRQFFYPERTPHARP